MSFLPARVLAIGAFAVMAAVGPLHAALTTASTPAAKPQATGKCLAWFGSRTDGKCIGWEMDSSPSWSVGTNGIKTGPLLPGQSFNSSATGR